MILSDTLSVPGHEVYIVDQGVMMLKEIDSGKMYYFPATLEINPQIIKKQRPCVSDMAEIIENLTE